MAKTDYKTIDEYHQAFSGDVLKRLELIRGMIQGISPGATELVSYQIPAFKLAEKKFLIYYCAFPNHISLSSPWSAAFLNHFSEDLKNYKTSKSVIQFPNNKPLPLDFIERIVKFRQQECESKKN